MLAVIPFYYATSDTKTDVQMPPERHPSPPVKEPIDEPPIEKSKHPHKEEEIPLI